MCGCWKVQWSVLLTLLFFIVCRASGDGILVTSVLLLSILCFICQLYDNNLGAFFSIQRSSQRLKLMKTLSNGHYIDLDHDGIRIWMVHYFVRQSHFSKRAEICINMDAMDLSGKDDRERERERERKHRAVWICNVKLCRKMLMHLNVWIFLFGHNSNGKTYNSEYFEVIAIGSSYSAYYYCCCYYLWKSSFLEHSTVNKNAAAFFPFGLQVNENFFVLVFEWTNQHHFTPTFKCKLCVFSF